MPSQPSVHRTDAEIRKALETQRDFLIWSSESYDSGRNAEAVRLASAIYQIVYDSGSQHSILEQLTLKAKMLFHDTALRPSHLDSIFRTGLAEARATGGPAAEYEFVTFTGGAGLTSIGAGPNGGEPTHQPFFHRNPMTTQLSAFDPWWTDPIVEMTNGQVHSRKDLVLWLRHKDGGAHTDPERPADYVAALIDQRSILWAPTDRTRKTGDRSAFRTVGGSVVEASVRQVAYELLETIESNRGLIWPNQDGPPPHDNTGHVADPGPNAPRFTLLPLERAIRRG